MTKINRRHVIQGSFAISAAAGLSACVAGREAIPDEFGPFSANALQADLVAYDGFGHHRSGGAGDTATSQWLEAGFQTLGYSTERMAFPAPDHDALDAALELPDGRISLGAQPPFREANTVSAELVYAGAAGPHGLVEGKILVAETPYARHSDVMGPATAAFVELAQNGRAAALILIINGPSRDIAYLNINLDDHLPLMTLASPATAGPLRAAAMAGASARLTTPRPTGRRPAFNVIARRAGAGPHIVISTPISGWTHCAAERGPGVAVIRALSHWLVDAAPGHAITLFAASGHELDGLGGRLFLESGAPVPEDTALWVHLGSGWAARDWHETPRRLLPLDAADSQRYLMASPDILPAVQTAFAGQPGLSSTYPLTVETAAGELRQITGHGYTRVFGAFGAHRRHHVMSDRMDGVSGDLVAAPARAFREAIAAVILRVG